MASLRFLASASAGVFLLSGCGFGGPTHRVAAEEPPELEYPESVSEIAWEWQAPAGEDPPRLREVPGGVAVFHSEGVTVLSGENGERLWEYRDQGRVVLGNVSDDGERVLLHVFDDFEDEETQMVVLASDTGEVLHDYPVNMDERIVGGGELSLSIRPGLRAVTEQAWFTAEPEGALRAHTLGDGEELWRVEQPFDCEGTGSVEAVMAWEEAVVLAYTCVQAVEEGGQEVEADTYTPNTEYVSALVGLEPEDGTELWRDQERRGRYAQDSLERTFQVVGGRTLLVGYPYGHLGQVVDPAEGPWLSTEEGSVPVWVSDDKERVGVWDHRGYGYGMVDRQGRVLEEAHQRDVYVMGLVDTPVGLAQGVVHTEGFEGEGTHMVAFDDGKEIVPFRTDDSLALESAPTAVAVPGAVAVSYRDMDGDRYVVGLQ